MSPSSGDPGVMVRSKMLCVLLDSDRTPQEEPANTMPLPPTCPPPRVSRFGAVPPLLRGGSGEANEEGDAHSPP
jgi:hypothetical protein